jgi:predicted O-methyltransferase YrrM
MISNPSLGETAMWSAFAAISRENTTKWIDRAETCRARGDIDEALACCVKSLSVAPDREAAFSLLARIVMPGDNYLRVLAQLHEGLKPQSYVEIGVAHGNSLCLARPETRTVGIDPHPHIQAPIRSFAKLYPLPSDRFFASYDLLNELETPRLALCFIDGLHEFEQALKDFINVERYSDPETVVVIHDCLPVSRLVGTRARTTNFWCGDVWKIVFCLTQYRPDLALTVLPVSPSGLAIITKLDPGSSILCTHRPRIIAEFEDRPLPYDFLSPDTLRTAMPNVVSNAREYITQMLSRHLSAAPGLNGLPGS